jgi:hypothetical protein
VLRREDPDAVRAMRLRIGAASEASQQSLMHQQRAHVGMLQSSAETVDIDAGRHGPSEGRSEGGFSNGIIHSFKVAGSISDDSRPFDPELLLGASSFLGFQSWQADA